MPDQKDIQKLAGTVGSGLVMWEWRPCKYCGRDARYPISLVEGTELHAVAAICDECEGQHSYDAMREKVDEMHDPDVLIERSGIAPQPEVALVDATRRWLESTEPGLFLCGDINAGKTWQVCQLVKEWCRTTRRPAMYVTEIDLHEQLKEWSRRPELRQSFRTVPLLVIDDLGTDKATEFKAGEIFDLVDFRDRHARNKRGETVLRTVFVSNHSPGVLKQLPTMDERVLVRISRLCGGSAKTMKKEWEETR